MRNGEQPLVKESKTIIIDPEMYLAHIRETKQFVKFDDYMLQYIEFLIETKSLQMAFDAYASLVKFKLERYPSDVCLKFDLQYGGSFSTYETLELPQPSEITKEASVYVVFSNFYKSYLLY